MKKYNRLLALLLVLCLVLSVVPAVSAEETLPLASADEVVVLYTNDVHTYIDGDISYDTIADLKLQIEGIADVLLVDAGDHIQGTAYGSMDKGETITALMEDAGYNLATLGNHEFDYGMARALEVATEGAIPYVSCNFYHEEDGVVGDTVLEAYQILEAGGQKIAFIGVTTPETFTKSTPAYFQDEDGNYIYGIAGGEDGSDLYAAVQNAIDAAEAEGVDYVIALAHLGDDASSQPWTSEEVIANTTGLDAVIDGHSHSTVPMKEVEDKNGDTVILTQTGEYFNAIGRMSITAEGIETGLITFETITEKDEDGNKVVVDEYVGYTSADGVTVRTDWVLGEEEETNKRKEAWLAAVDEKLGEVIGEAQVVFDNYDEDGVRLVRRMETNTGDFAADALYYLFDETMGLDVDVAIMNGGGVRNKTITGEISYKTCKDIHTFGNVACLQTITGQQLKDALEWGARNAGKTGEDGSYLENGGFLHVAGVTYDINPTVTSGAQADDKGVWTGHDGDYVVQNIRVWDKEAKEYVPLDLEAEYNLAGYNYTLRDLGDGFAMFDGAVNVVDYVMEDYMVLANYVQSFEDGVITAEDGPEYRISEETGSYANVTGEGRVNFSNFTDVGSYQWFYSYIQDLTVQGVVNGYPDGTFRPDNKITRAEFCKMLCGVLEVGKLEYTKSFNDLEEGAWYYDYVMTLAEMGIVDGYTDGSFLPDNDITRQEMVTMVYRLQMMLPVEYQTSDLSQFSDAVNVADWARAAMQWGVGDGVINGRSADMLFPEDNTTRAEVSKALLCWMELNDLSGTDKLDVDALLEYWQNNASAEE